MSGIHLTRSGAEAAFAQVIPTLLRLVSLAVVCAVCCATDVSASEPNVVDDGYFQVVERIDLHVWVLVEPRFQIQPVGNVAVIEQTDGLVLVDSGGSPGSGRRVVAAIRRLSAKPVKAVILTHWHGDHVQGLSEVLKAWPGTETIATVATQAHLREPKTMNSPGAPDPAANASGLARIRGYGAYAKRMARDAQTQEERAGWEAAMRLFTQYELDMDGAVTLAPVKAVKSRLTLSDAKAPVEIRFLGRANTDGDAIVWLPRQQILVTGDVVVSPLPFGYGSYPTEWLQVLQKLKRYPFKVLVPGHGAPQHDTAYVDRLVSALEEVRSRVSPLVPENLSLDDAKRRLDFTDQAIRFVGDDIWLRRWFQAYWIDPIVGSAYREARGEPIVQSLGGG